MQQFQINPKKGRQEWLARMGAAAPATTVECFYGTGWDIAATDALTYLLQQRMLQSEQLCLENHSVYQLAHPQVCAIGEAHVAPSLHVSFDTAGTPTLVRRYRVQARLPVESSQLGPVSPASIVDLIRMTFALSVSDAADVFRVSRPTIYQWSKLESLDLVRSSNDRERLKKLYGIAAVWAARPKLSGRWYLTSLPSGKTIIDILKGETLDSEEFSRFHTLLEQQNSLIQGKEHMKAKEAALKLKWSASTMEQDRPKRSTKGGI